MEKAATLDDVLAVIDRLFEKREADYKELKALFKETDRQIKETAAQMKEKAAQTDAQIKETAAQMKATNKRISELGGRLGEMVEYIVSPHLEHKFTRFGIKLDTIIIEHTLEEPGKGIIAEIDVFLSNGEYAVAVEVKSKPSIKDVDEHVKRMKKLRGYADRHNDKRKYMGAIAGMVVTEQVKKYAFKQGFPILTPSGDSIELECPEGFSPKEW
ncbi:MAG: hypothetical protein LBD79_10420 [Treponema sp.]|jgi:hypothetical protein|nr:hypothetical protein [Treponema sp.]